MLKSGFMGLSAAILCFAAAFEGACQTQQPKNQVPEGATAPAGPVAVATSLSEPPVAAARISLANGQLTVDARNSELNQILQDIARLTGMSLNGLTGGKHVYGVYGPSDPRSVLTALLQASGSNFLLVGSETRPRELIVTPETKAPPTVAKAPEPEPQQDEPDDQWAQQDSTDPN